MTDESTAPESAMLAACNPIPPDLESWDQAPFPVLTRNGHHPVILLGVAGTPSVVFGLGFWGDTPESAWSVSMGTWAPNGAYGTSRERGEHTGMDLDVPPAAMNAELARLRGELDEILQRLADNPNAPEAWLARDRQQAAILQRKLDKLVPPAADAA